jgi:hypothetical protein
MVWWVPIIVAFIGGPMMWGLHRFDRRNTEQHNQNHHVLERIETKIEKLDDRIHGHIDWHASKETEPKEKNYHEVF